MSLERPSTRVESLCRTLRGPEMLSATQQERKKGWEEGVTKSRGFRALAAAAALLVFCVLMAAKFTEVFAKPRECTGYCQCTAPSWLTPSNPSIVWSDPREAAPVTVVLSSGTWPGAAQGIH